MVSRVLGVFASVLDACLISSVSSAFRHKLQVWRLNVSKVDRVLHLSSPFAASPRCPLLLAPAGHPLPIHPLLDVGDIRGGMGARDCMDVRALAKPVE